MARLSARMILVSVTAAVALGWTVSPALADDTVTPAASDPAVVNASDAPVAVLYSASEDTTVPTDGATPEPLTATLPSADGSPIAVTLDSSDGATATSVIEPKSGPAALATSEENARAWVSLLGGLLSCAVAVFGFLWYRKQQPRA